ncbi:NADH-quinone oxidoreductase subunit M [Nocardioides terrisoli]|uniref:NADH-quinone oxidoreductase subunit M n=1 Tax=Nocardioides terrisoli TaxID=3388267 RepID=UPI00287B9F1D|nr:NADH-quinone oxidoreductase subunit M [Nocardioides marmorisolisilvae]
MNGFPWLTLLLFAPIVFAIVVAAVPARPLLSKQLALALSLVVLAFSIVIAVRFDPHGGMQFQESHEWIRSFGAHYALGVDGLGLTLVLLTTILTPVVILASWHDGDRVGGAGFGAGLRPEPRWGTRSFFAWLLALEGLAIGCFIATDVFLFYVLFEAVLIPVYFLIGGFGGFGRARAAVKFLLYSLTGGLIMLAAVIGVYVESAKVAGHPTYLLSDLTRMDLGQDVSRWLFVGFFIAFAVKAPIFPVHTWLPDACEQATPGTNTLLVSVLDKIGSFGMIRFGLELFPGAAKWATPVVIVLAIISIIYGALMAIGSNNIPRLIAYTSVSHFGFIVLGIFVMNSQGLVGANLYMFAHGLSTAAVFLTGGFLATRRGSALISDMGGIEKVAPVLAGFFLVANLSLLSLPGLSPFVPELLVIIGAFVHSAWAAAFAVTGIVLAAMYALILYQRTMTGPTHPEAAGMRDLNVREVVAVAPVVALLVVLGFFPKPLTAVLNPSVDHTMSQVGRTDPAPTVPQATTEGSAQ